MRVLGKKLVSTVLLRTRKGLSALKFVICEQATLQPKVLHALLYYPEPIY